MDRKIFLTLAMPVLSLLACSSHPDKIDMASAPDNITPVNAWQTIETGGDTMCSDGSPYRFHVKTGQTKNLFIFLNGGGGCWNAQTCDTRTNTQTFVPRADLAHNDPNNHKGVFDLENAKNPVKDWTMVFVPYCTGDIHLGAENREYTAQDGYKFTVNHAGAANTRSVLNWVQTHLSPEKIVVAGASAGALASPVYAGEVATTYPNANVIQFAGGASGYISPKASAILSQWGGTTSLAETKYSELDPELANFYSFYPIENESHPQIKFALYDTAFDHVQVQFRQAMGENTSLLDAIKTTYDNLDAEVTSIAHYLAPGDFHTILRYDKFYTESVQGEPFVDWFAAMLQGQTPPAIDCSQVDSGCAKQEEP